VLGRAFVLTCGERYHMIRGEVELESSQNDEADANLLPVKRMVRSQHGGEASSSSILFTRARVVSSRIVSDHNG
jgi:hypothetical protein